MDSDLDDINKIQSALNGKSRSDDFTISEASNQSKFVVLIGLQYS